MDPDLLLMTSWQLLQILLKSTDIKTEKKLLVYARFKVDVKKVYGFGNNGASLIRGCKNGIASQMKGKDPLWVTIHCMTHRLNLASAQAAESVPYLKDVFQKTMTDLYYFLNHQQEHPNYQQSSVTWINQNWRLERSMLCAGLHFMKPCRQSIDVGGPWLHTLWRERKKASALDFQRKLLTSHLCLLCTLWWMSFLPWQNWAR